MGDAVALRNVQMTVMPILRWCLLLATVVTHPALAQVDSTRSANTGASLANRRSNSAVTDIGGTGIGRTGQRQSRDDTARGAGIKPTARITGRIANRIQSRLRNRIDRNYNPTSNATSPFVIAARQSQAR